MDLWLPPLSEQAKIVRKIDELMILCDELEHSLLEKVALLQQLSGAIVAEIAA